MQPEASSPPLTLRERLDRLGRSELLGPEELTLLEQPEVRALPHAAQWEHLRTNRRVGYFVTLLAGGIRLLLLLGGAAAALAFGLRDLGQPEGPLAWEPHLVLGLGLALAGLGLWLGRGFLRRLAQLRRRLPPADELGLR